MPRGTSLLRNLSATPPSSFYRSCERMSTPGSGPLVKRILGKHSYPPDKQEKATVTVLGQAEVVFEGWATA